MLTLLFNQGDIQSFAERPRFTHPCLREALTKLARPPLVEERVFEMAEATDFVPSVRILPTTEDTSSKYFGRLSSRVPTRNLKPLVESVLLRSIRSVIQKSAEPIASKLFDSRKHAEVTLSWSKDTVVFTVGGTHVQSWSFGEEGQDIQTVCWGWLESPRSGPSSSQPAYDHGVKDPPATAESGPPKKLLCLFVFFRSVAKLHMEDGTQFTIHLPFLTRAAWPLHPHGVMVQRVVSASERRNVTPHISILPTLFTLTDPSSELKVVEENLGEHKSPNPAHPRPSSESTTSLPLSVVQWVADYHTPARLVVTTSSETRRFTICSYNQCKDDRAAVKESLASAASRNLAVTGSGSDLLSSLPGDMPWSPGAESTGGPDRMALGTQSMPAKSHVAAKGATQSAFAFRRLFDQDLPFAEYVPISYALQFSHHLLQQSGIIL